MISRSEKFNLRIIVIATGFVALLVNLSTSAQDRTVSAQERTVSAQERTISVEAEGIAFAKPDQLKFSVTLAKSAETSKKAKVAFDELRKAFHTNFNVMKFKGLSIKSKSKAFSPQPNYGPVPIGGGGAPVPVGPGTNQFSISETFEMTLSGIDKISSENLESEILNYITELKKLGLVPLVFSTSVKDKDELTKQAMAIAMKKAKSKAAFLAELSGGSLGKIITSAENSRNSAQGFAPYYPAPFATNSGVMSEKISVTSHLLVVFKLED